jgi:hypothetical protein
LKELDRMIPLTVPMGVRNDMGVEHGEPAKSNERQRNALNLNESAVSIQPDAPFPRLARRQTTGRRPVTRRATITMSAMTSRM